MKAETIDFTIITAREAAAVLRVHERTIYRLARLGKLPGRKIGGSWRFSRREILELIERGISVGRGKV